MRAFSLTSSAAYFDCAVLLARLLAVRLAVVFVAVLSVALAERALPFGDVSFVLLFIYFFI